MLLQLLMQQQQQQQMLVMLLQQLSRVEVLALPNNRLQKMQM
jgi:hypothetical protein